MDITKEQAIAFGFISLFLLSIGGISYTVFDKGEEVVCRTNKPFGWDILASYATEEGMIYKAECPYATKEPIIEYCKDFRSTASYERYGCDAVVLVENAIQTPKPLPEIEGKLNANGKDWDCIGIEPYSKCYSGNEEGYYGELVN